MAKRVPDSEETTGRARLSDPEMLERLRPPELLNLVRPLLRAGGLTEPKHRYDRIAPNVAGVCAELAIQWRQNPRLSSGKPVPFDEYLAARLYSRLRELEQQEYPDLYDAHRVYQPDWEPLPLRADAAGAETGEPCENTGPQADPSYHQPLGAEQEPRWSVRLEQTMNLNRIAAASQAAIGSALSGLQQGTVTSPYRFARALGHNTDLAHQRPPRPGDPRPRHLPAGGQHPDRPIASARPRLLPSGSDPASS